MHYFKDRTEYFDDYYPFSLKSIKDLNLHYVYNWIKLFTYLYNVKIRKKFLSHIRGEIVQVNCTIKNIETNKKYKIIFIIIYWSKSYENAITMK